MQLRVVSLLVVAATQVAYGEDCPPAAVVEGDGTLVDLIDAALKQRGIATEAPPQCPVARAVIERSSKGVSVRVTDPNGRSSQRTLADHDAAASLIESWARQDMNASALLGFTDPVPVAAPAEAPRVDTQTPTTAPTRARDMFSVAAAVESSLAFSGGSFVGARVAGCMRIGPVCAGATGRFMTADPNQSVDVLGSIDVPFALSSRTVLLAGGGVGMGWYDAPLTQGERMTTVTTTGVRLDAHASVSVAIAPHVSFHAGISLGASPQAPATLIADGDAPVTNDEPAGFFRGDLGLRIGVP